MKTARTPCGLAAVLWVLVSLPAMGQRVYFPSSVEPPGTSPVVPPATSPPAIPGPAPGPVVTQPPPTATFDGTIQPPRVDWDPYATPGATPPALLPQAPYFQSGVGGTPGTVFTTMQRFVQEVRLDYVWMPGNGMDEFGIHDAELSATFAFPMFYNQQTPLLVTPGFAVHCWSGPKVATPPWPEVPSRVYDAYLDAAWNPQLTPWLGGELSCRVGVYSDFKRVTSESMRYMGKGMMVLSFTPSIKLKAGVWYLDRQHVKMLPAGGLIWEPNPDVYFNILFPDPKIARRLTNFGSTEWWLYVRGEYGGGTWTLRQPDASVLPMDYNDIRVGVGLEFIRPGGLTGLFEVGLAFERELYFSPAVEIDPNNTVFLRGGLAY